MEKWREKEGKNKENNGEEDEREKEGKIKEKNGGEEEREIGEE